jgi:N12 class adenine-specific DNA methylase
MSTTWPNCSTTALAQLGVAVFHNPATEAWETDDAYLSGTVRTKLALAGAAAERDSQYARNVAARRRVQPDDLLPSDITAKLGAPWIATADIEAFAAAVMGTATCVRHTVEIAAWSVEIAPFASSAAGASEWGTSRRNAGWLLHDALNSTMPQIFDTVVEDGVEKRVLNSKGPKPPRRSWRRSRMPSPAGSGLMPTAPTGSPESTTTVSTTWCRAGSTVGT